MSAQTDEVLFAVRGCAGIITLNRPAALNAVTLTIVRAMRRQLDAWAQDDQVARVIIKAAEGRAFSAGGDVRQLYDWGMAGDDTVRQFYREEYALNTLIKRFAKPYIALIDGIVMGGGVGVSVHGSHRVAGSSMMFAMPETGIGLFPDVGGTWFLPRLPGEAGMYLGLTGARIGPADALALGIATHAVPSERFGALEDALTAARDIDACIANFAAPPGEGKLAAHMQAITHCFSGTSVADIVGRLTDNPDQPFGQKTAGIIAGKSPTSLEIAYRQLRAGAKLSFEDCMRLEFRIVSRVLQGSEFFEGIRAIIIDKDNAPRWTPATLEDARARDIDAYFAKLGDEELVFP